MIVKLNTRINKQAIVNKIENTDKQAGLTNMKLDLRRRNRQEKVYERNMSIYEPESFSHFQRAYYKPNPLENSNLEWMSQMKITGQNHLENIFSRTKDNLNISRNFHPNYYYKINPY